MEYLMYFERVLDIIIASEETKKAKPVIVR